VSNRVISSRQMLRGRLFPSPCGREKGNFLFSRYLLIKLLFLANVIGQFFLLSTFLDCNFPAFGVELLQSMVRGDPWEGFRRFPRVTMCDLKVIFGDYTEQYYKNNKLLYGKNHIALHFYVI
jgi:hypothetical protein